MQRQRNRTSRFIIEGSSSSWPVSLPAGSEDSVFFRYILVAKYKHIIRNLQEFENPSLALVAMVNDVWAAFSNRQKWTSSYAA
jgi:hypothetical protein